MKRVKTLIAISSLLLAANVFAETPNFPHIVTTGYGEVVATPDTATFTVKVVETAMAAEQAKAAADKVVNRYLDALEKDGVSRDDVSSSNLYLAPQYHYPKSGQPELIGYRASRNIDVTLNDITRLNVLLDTALQSGITHVENVQLKVKNEQRYKDQARLAAIKNANDKASSLAEGFDKELGQVWRVSYNGTSSQPVLMRSMAMDAKAESMGYEDSTLIIRDRVDVIYQLED
ncbi:oxidative stress defense protein [Vibrio maerlii]|uniref:oxidative stress defense protein n=1 Tax=Vibrio maerlii TaxID=2231648 RepID=UPI000E3D354D|nr:oxidative stress defense protein [Vibrio maerlii]